MIENFLRLSFYIHIMIFFKGTSVTHTHFSITNNSVETHDNYVSTKLSVLDSRVRSRFSVLLFFPFIVFHWFYQTGEERVVEHLQFISWPDYGVPESALAMLGFLEEVRLSQAKLTASMGKSWNGHPLGPPILVHCSAGIGRTGL